MVLKVLLIHPSFVRKIGKTTRLNPELPPMGLSYLAAVLMRELGQEVDVKILDLNAVLTTREQLLNYVDKYKPDIVGLSAVTVTIDKSFEIAKDIKEFDKNIQIVFGGVHPTSLPEESMKKKFVDFVVIGEGEETFLELVKELMKKKGKKNFKKIKGLVWKQGKKIVKNGVRVNLTKLDDLPFPAIELLPLDKYISHDTKHPKFMTILTSRGCPGMCTFCNKLTFGHTCYMRSAENIIAEIEKLYKQGFRDFHILDDLFTNDRQRVVDFCNLILKKKLKIHWKCCNGIRVSTVDLPLLKLMKKTGCYMLNYGVESGNQKILNNIKKGQTLAQVEHAVKLTKKAKINVGCCFMFGNEGENSETMQQTIDFAKKLNPDIAMFSILIPYPGTPVHDYVKKNGTIFAKKWVEYDNFGGKAVFEYKDLKKEVMEDFYKRAYKEYYLRPRYFLSQIFKKRSVVEFKERVNAFFALLEM